MVEILCIVAIIFLSIIWVLLASILLKIRKILTPFTEMADGYQQLKAKADIVSQVVTKKITEKLHKTHEQEK